MDIEAPAEPITNSFALLYVDLCSIQPGATTRPTAKEAWLVDIPALNLRIPWPEGMTLAQAIQSQKVN